MDRKITPVTTAIVLAGGFGTRLSNVVSDVPKPMAPIGGKPFLCYLLRKLQRGGITEVILSTGYLHEKIEEYFGDRWEGMEIVYSRETEPLQTGGAIALALEKCTARDVLVLNGDTLFDINLERFAAFHAAHKADVSVALRRVKDTTRYGSVKVLRSGHITGFTEKSESGRRRAGLINGGIYLVNKKYFERLGKPRKFSFEKDILQSEYGNAAFYGLKCYDYFIDIGIPEDYLLAQKQLPPCTWERVRDAQFLFLDRDGVINRRIPDGYVTSPEEFVFMPGALEAIARFTGHYGRIIVATNQQGVAKGVMSAEQLAEVHSEMCDRVEEAGGVIDSVYSCTDSSASNSPDRKPAPGIALAAAEYYPEIDLSRSLMIGDSLSDMQFAANAGMACAFISNGEKVPKEVYDYTLAVCRDLREFCTFVPALNE